MEKILKEHDTEILLTKNKVWRKGRKKGKEALSEGGKLEGGKREEIFSALLDLVCSSQQEGTTPLHEACCYGNTECIRVLLKHKACVNIW